MRVPQLDNNMVGTAAMTCAVVTCLFSVIMSRYIYLDAKKLFPSTENGTRLIEEVCSEKGAISFPTMFLIAVGFQVLSVVLVLSLGLYVRNVKFKAKRGSDMRRFNHISSVLVRTYTRTRRMYSCLRRNGDYPYVKMELDDKELRLQKRSVLAGLGHPNLITTPGPNDASCLILTEYIFLYHTMEVEEGFTPPHFTQMAVIMRDVLRAVQYLHANHIYHLDLKPDCILIYYSFKDARSCTAKVGRFDFAKRLEDGKVAWKETGLEGFWRPPEYFLDLDTLEVDAAKIDAWGIGMTAYELFSRKMLTILADSTIPTTSTLAELVSTRHALKQKFFSSMIESSLNIIRDIDRFSKYKFAISMYDLDYKSFIKDCWEFVRGLSEFDPVKRFSVEMALNTPLITKVRDEPVPRKPRGKLLTKLCASMQSNDLMSVLCKN